MREGSNRGEKSSNRKKAAEKIRTGEEQRIVIKKGNDGDSNRGSLSYRLDAIMVGLMKDNQGFGDEKKNFGKIIVFGK